MKVTKRIGEIIKFANGAVAVGDIGCDHGYVGIELINSYGVNKVIFADILRAPLCSAISNVKLYNIPDSKVDFRVGDGLEPIEIAEVDTVIITGMGGKLISEIMNADIEKSRSFQRYVLQPTNSESVLRKWLSENDFLIVNESLIEDNGVFYETLLVELGSERLTDTQIKFGKFIDYKDQNFINKYSSLLHKLEKTKSQIPVKNEDVHDSFRTEITEIKKVLNQ